MSPLCRHACPILFALLLSSACASNKQPETSGFLESYPELSPSIRDRDVFIWIAEDIEKGRYQRLMIDPVVLFLVDEPGGVELSPEDRAELARTFREAMIEEVQDAYEIVDAPAPDVLRLRFAITRVLPVPADESRGDKNLAVDLGGATMEAEALDSASGRRLAVLVSTKRAETFYTSLGIFTTLGQAKQAFREWAKLMRTGLDLRT